MATNVLGTVYEKLLYSLVMDKAVKIDAKINRKTKLLLDAMIRQATDGKAAVGLLEIFSEYCKQELKQLADECLKKQVSPGSAKRPCPFSNHLL